MNLNRIYLPDDSRYSTKKVRLHPADAYDIWVDHYHDHLIKMYQIFTDKCIKNSVDWHNKIDIESFIHFVYTHSSEYLSLWV